MSEFRDLNLYMFFTSGDLLDAPNGTNGAGRVNWREPGTMRGILILRWSWRGMWLTICCFNSSRSSLFFNISKLLRHT